MQFRWPPSVVTVGMILAAFLALNAWLLWGASRATVIVWNDDRVAHTVRVIDGWTGRHVVTGRVEPRSAVIAFDGRFDEWWVANESRANRQHRILVEVLGEGCELLGTGWTEGSSSGGTTVIDSGGAVASTHLPVAISPQGFVPVPDPCDGAVAAPRGQIINRTTGPISVGHGVVVPACDVVTLHPGDLPDGSLPEPNTPAGVARIIVPSIDAQDERWPIEPRTVVVVVNGASDGTSSIDPESLPCAGTPPDGLVATRP